MKRSRGAPTRRCRSLAVAVLAVVTLSCGGGGGGGGGGGPTQPPLSVFGAVGASLTQLAIEGYNSIGGTRGWPDEELGVYGGAGIARWAAEIGQPGSKLWRVFRSLLESQPGTDQIWWHIVPFFNGPTPTVLSPADQDIVIRVGDEIRRLVGPSMPIYASPTPNYAPSSGCTEISKASVQLARLMVDFAVAQGLAEPGPRLRPITSETNNGPGNPCHQGAKGRQQHGQDLRNFFGG